MNTPFVVCQVVCNQHNGDHRRKCLPKNDRQHLLINVEVIDPFTRTWGILRSGFEEERKNSVVARNDAAGDGKGGREGEKGQHTHAATQNPTFCYS